MTFKITYTAVQNNVEENGGFEFHTLILALKMIQFS